MKLCALCGNIILALNELAACRKRLEVQGKDKAFVSMLHVLDRCHLDHEVKWALVQKHTADKAEFR